MLVKGVKIAGWRSFAPEHPAEAKDLGSVNLFMGPNNVGKSNLGRFLVRLRDLLKERGYHNEQPWGEGSVYYTPLMVTFVALEVDHWLREEAPIEAEITLSTDALKAPTPLPSMLFSEDEVRFKVSMSKVGNQGTLAVVPLTQSGQPVIKSEGSSYKLLLPHGIYTEQVTSVHTHRGIALAACKCIAEAIIEIRPLRDPMRQATTQRDRSTDGGDIIGALEARQNDQNLQGFWGKCKRDLESWFGILLGEENPRIEINSGRFWIETSRGEHSLRCELPDLGAGVSEILMVLAYLRLHPDQKFLVVIDEPEAHLHPGAVVELAKIITKHLPNHQLLVTTHSTALIDVVTPEWRAFRVRRAAHHGTSYEVLDTTHTELALLADLGLRPSQLFLARVTLWVEGPSDVHYWSALLREVDKTLVIGRDFTFITYGGASSSHLGFDEEDDADGSDVNKLVQVLKASHRAAIICDRDRNAIEDERALIKRLVAAAEKLPQHALVVTSTGREIENGVRPEVLLRVLEEIRPKRFNKPKLQISYVDYTIGIDDAFDEIVAKAARTHDGMPLSAEQVEMIKQRLDQRKHRIAERIREIGFAGADSVFRDAALQKAKELVVWILAEPTGAQCVVRALDA